MRTSYVIAGLFGLGALGFALTAGGAEGDDDVEPLDHDDDVPDADDSDGVGICAGLQKRERIECLLGRTSLDDTQRKFLVLTAYGESRFNRLIYRGNSAVVPNVPGLKGNHDLGDAAAAEVAYKRHRAYFDKCGHAPVTRYTYGSGGWFQFLPANALWNVKGTWPCWPPEKIFDAAASIVMAIAMARELQEYAAFKASPHVGVLRTGWWWPKKMAGPPADRIAKYRKHAETIGLGASFIDRTIAPFPGNYAALYSALGGT